MLVWLTQEDILSVDCFREDHSCSLLSCSADRAISLKQRPPSGRLCIERSLAYFKTAVATGCVLL